jgi:pyridoxal phosphate enzyme (YggS family)
VIEASAVGDRLVEARARIERAGGHDVTIVAVTKGFGADAIRAALACGLTDVGENYAQELLAKLADLDPVASRPRVHFIGHLQTNKVRSLVPAVDVWQTVDRIGAGRAIASRSPGAVVLVQVNVSDEQQKGGCTPADAPGLVAELREQGLHVDGLMTVGRTGRPEDARPGFRLLRRLVDELGLTTCSMGMTDDLEVAVGEGSTMVRLGSALFGMRPVLRARAH